MCCPGQATFVVQVSAPPHLTVLSNMLEASSSTTYTGGSNGGGSTKLVTFLPTPPMSTYLLSVVVGELQAVAANTTRCAVLRGC